MEKEPRKKAYDFLALTAVFALAALLCLFLYNGDNKYTAPGPKGQNGLLILDEQELNNNPVLFLVEGWEYYGGRLLVPEDFANAAPVPDAYIFIGQYGGFDAGNMSASPHGSATYRLTLKVPDVKIDYLLELPEIFSAYHAYVNGELVKTMGDPDPAHYRPETGNKTVAIKASGQIEIIIAVSDFSHLYSGLTYPPAFGEPDAVGRLLTARLVFRGVLAAFALAVGVLALLVGVVSRRNTTASLYGLLCLFFVGFTSYPIIQSLVGGFYPFYVLENVSFCAMLATVMLLQRSIIGGKSRIELLPVGFGALMCLFSILLPFTLPSGSLKLIGAYSVAVMAYEWITAVYLTATTIRASLVGTAHSKILLSGILVFDAALIMDRLLPMFEPTVSGWFPELFSFVLILCIGAVVAREVAAKYKDSAVIYERMNSMERLTQMQRANYGLLMERIEETKSARHDLRHHFVMIEAFLQNKDYEKLEAYVRKFQTSVEHIQSAGYAKNPVVDILARHYARLAENSGVDLSLRLKNDKNVTVSEADLCALLSNLLENSLEACLRQESGKRYITLSMGQKPSMLSIRMENSTDGKVEKHGDIFMSAKEEGRKGYGLDSVLTIARRYNGDAEFVYDNETQVFTSTVVLFFE